MASSAPSSLLSLTGQVEDLLLSFVGSGEGGLQSVLNLRKVCSTTKDWVDSLQPREGRRLLSKCQAFVHLKVRELQRFLKTPPPFEVTSLRLLQTDHLHSNIIKKNKTADWSSFVDRWAPKLESLEIDVLSLPLDAGVLKLLSSPSLRRLYCYSIKIRRGVISQPNLVEFPRVLFNLEEVCVDNLDMAGPKKQSFFRQMSTNTNLKRFWFIVSFPEEIEGVRILMDAMKDNADLELTMRFSRVPDQYLLVGLAHSVAAASSSKIRILGLNLEGLCYVKINMAVHLVSASPFFSSVAWISSFSSLQTYLDMERFPNMKRIDYFTGNERTLARTQFPPKLEHLRTFLNFVDTSRLPTNLVHLEMSRLESTVTKLMELLTSLATNCTLLRSLAVKWTCKPSADSEADSLHLHTENLFSNLRSLTFHGSFSREDSPTTVKRILLDGFKLHQLSLLKVNVTTCQEGGSKLRAPLIGTSTLSSIIGGPVATTLTSVEIGSSYVEKNAHLLLKKLKETAAENAVKRVETHGRCEPQTNFWFD